MKTLKLNKMVTLFFLMIGGIAVNAQQNQAEVPGDNFSLEGALELFKKSTSPEDFERQLNSSDSRVNNLDLNGDGDIDYIKVIDRNEGNVHAFILQAVISQTESQDVAVIELEKLANGKAVLQITGDADVYGIETIIEPTQEVRVNAGTSTTQAVVNVWAWPSVQYIYSPYYSSLWISPWGWDMRPMWWRPWRPVAYHVYNPWWTPYRPYYASCYSHRVSYAHHIYRPYRTTSIVVYNRHNTQITHYRSKHYDSNRNGNGGRDQYNGGRTNGRQNGSAHQNDSNGGRQNSSYSHNGGSRSTSDWNKNQSSLNRRSSTSREELTSRNRSTSDFKSKPSVTQRNSTSFKQQDLSKNRSSASDRNIRSQQQVTRPSSDFRSNQRSNTVQPNRTRLSSGSSGTSQRSGSRGNGGNSSSSGHNRKGGH